jgi:hypothetical protein
MVVCARPSVFKSFFAATQRLRLSRLFRWRRAADDVWIRARTFSIGQPEEIDRVYRIYPALAR